MKKPIIFLNIDGVLISENYILQNANNVSYLYDIIDGKIYMNFDPSKIKLINKIIEEVDANIVISSYWCTHSNLDNMKRIFKKYNLDNRIIGVVPYSNYKNGYRINKWINKNKEIINIDDFAIIDNEDIGILEDKHIKCDSKVGLTNEDVDKTLKLIKK